MSVSSTLLNAAAKQVELAFQAILAVPGTNTDLAQMAWDLDEIRKQLEGLAGSAPKGRILQEELGFE